MSRNVTFLAFVFVLLSVLLGDHFVFDEINEKTRRRWQIYLQMLFVSDAPKEKTLIPRSHPCQIMRDGARNVPSAKYPSKKATVSPTYSRWTDVGNVDRARCLEMSPFGPQHTSGTNIEPTDRTWCGEMSSFWPATSRYPNWLYLCNLQKANCALIRKMG